MTLSRRKSNRLKKYNYSQGGYYFVTICTKDKKAYFGVVKNEVMILNGFGNIIQQQWLWLVQQYSFVRLDEFIVMPNHLHGILIMNSNSVGTGRDLSLQTIKIKSLSELIGAFKTTSSKLIHRLGSPDFLWQRSFYDHIIRNEKSFKEIRQYIRNNPLKWYLDKNNPENLAKTYEKISNFRPSSGFKD